MDCATVLFDVSRDRIVMGGIPLLFGGSRGLDGEAAPTEGFNKIVVDSCADCFPMRGSGGIFLDLLVARWTRSGRESIFSPLCKRASMLLWRQRL